MTDAVLDLLSAIAAQQAAGNPATLIRTASRALLSHPRDTILVAFAILDPSDAARAYAARALLSAILDEARIATENDLPDGPALLHSLSEALSTHDQHTPLTPTARLSLASAYARAGLSIPPWAMLAPHTMRAPLEPWMPDLDDLLTPALDELYDTPLQAHAAISELIAALPPEMVTIFISMIVAREGDAGARLGLYWLLDQSPDIRLGAAAALLSRAEQKTLHQDAARLLPILRKWLPDTEARTVLDATIRCQMRNTSVAHTKADIKLLRTAISLPDGVGAQSVIVVTQTGSQRHIGMTMLKQGYGVKDAFVISCRSATEQKQFFAQITDNIDVCDVPPEAISQVLAWALGDGLASGRLPAPGLLDILDLLPVGSVAPEPSLTADMLAAIASPEILSSLAGSVQVKTSAEWMQRAPHLDSWFEDTGALRTAIGRARTPAGREKAIWKHLETRREWWSRIFASSAGLLKFSQDDLWLPFATAAQAMQDGQPLKKLPILNAIAATTLEAWEDTFAPEAPQNSMALRLGDALKQMGRSAAYLDGYLVALTISPYEPTPEDWMGRLIQGIEFKGEGSLHRVIEAITERASTVEEMIEDSDTLKATLGILSAPDLRDWSAGFSALVDNAPYAWPAKLLAADDRRLLKIIAGVGRESDPTDLRPLLPAWVSRRYSLRK
ncbi:UPF0149 family protein [Pararhodobacter sp. CCB-MM2]|uniref:UPF0149 family protein n=1 Tax=Pararhodobacter sp. CCB-MM2 TaxID=1786003 RepID=UPI000831F70B|nr:UPF0149 family protein [Pararhodobacter sp. CCB-MM2]